MPGREKEFRPARRLKAAALAAAIAGCPSAGAQEALPSLVAAPPSARTLVIERGRAALLEYEAELGTVILGDSAVAIASVARSDSIVLTGLAEGATNAIVLDGEGRRIDEINLRVIRSGRRIVVWRGLAREVQICNPSCAPEGEAAPVSATAESAASEDG